MSNFTDKQKMQTQFYNDGIKLKSRKKLYEYATPTKPSLDDVILEQIPKNAISILDAGCGYGRLLIKIHDLFPHISLTGTDIAKGILDEAKEKSSNKEIDIEYSVADLESLPFENESFDVIITEHVLHHIPDIQKAMNEVYRCLKPNGKYIVSFNGEKNLQTIDQILDIAKDCFDPTPSYANGKHITKKYLEDKLFHFQEIKWVDYEKKLHLFDPSPLIDYITTAYHRFSPTPPHEQWNCVVQKMTQFLENSLKQNGKIEDNIQAHIGVATK